MWTCFGNLVIVTGALLAMAAAPTGAGPFAVLVSGDAAVEVVAAADGQVLAGGRFDRMVIAKSTHADFSERLYRAGAWLVLPALPMESCLKPNSGAKQW